MAVKLAVAVGTCCSPCGSLARRPAASGGTIWRNGLGSSGQAFASPSADRIPAYPCLSHCPPRRGKADSSDMDILICLPPSLPDEDCGELLTAVGGKGLVRWQAGTAAAACGSPLLAAAAENVVQHGLRCHVYCRTLQAAAEYILPQLLTSMMHRGLVLDELGPDARHAWEPGSHAMWMGLARTPGSQVVRRLDIKASVEPLGWGRGGQLGEHEWWGVAAGAIFSIMAHSTCATCWRGPPMHLCCLCRFTRTPPRPSPSITLPRGR